MSYPSRTAIVTSDLAVRRSHAAIPVAIAVVLLGLYLGTISIFLPAALGLFLLFAAGSFLSARINPLSIGFYQGTKPSWVAIGVVFLAALVLFVVSYAYFVARLGPLVP